MGRTMAGESEQDGTGKVPNVGRKYEIRVIAAGLSGNNNFYPPDVLKAMVPLLEGVRVFVKADKAHLAREGKDFANLIGRLTTPRFVDAATGGEVRATLELLESAGAVAAKFSEAYQRGMSDLFGFSIDADGKTSARNMGGKTVRGVKQVTKVHSVDLIIEPGAGGKVINLIEAKGVSMDEDENDFLSKREINTLISTSRLPRQAQQRLIESFGERDDLTEAILTEAVKKEREYIGSFSESGKVTGLGGGARVELIEGRDEKIGKMLDAFFDPNDAQVVSFRECYLEITGDRNFTGMVKNCDKGRLTESLATYSFGQAIADAVHRAALKDYSNTGVFDCWKPIVTETPVDDFRENTRFRIGGYGDLPEVAELGAYLPLTSPDSEPANYKVAKRGGTEVLSMEMITNNQVDLIQRIPITLSRTAKRTLSRGVMSLFQANPVIYDGKALFHADHNNLMTDPLSAGGVAAGRLKLKQQRERGSNEKIGIGPRFLLVPDEQEETAVDLFRRRTENDKTFLQELTLSVIPVWCWDDANDWVLAADPLDMQGIEVGFLNGNKEPEIFIQDNPSVGSLFSNDAITFKVRHVWGVCATDYRAFVKSVVPAP